MILIYAPYPDPAQIRDGWMGRIGVVDRILKDRPRHYVFPGRPLYSHDPDDYRVGIAQVEDAAWMWWMDLRFALHWRRLTELVAKCDFVYAHTCHSSQVMLPYYRTGKVITDIHGIAPEEEELQGKPDQAAYFGAFEERMVRESAALVTVTQAMGDHFRSKYPGLETPIIDLPIVDDSFAGTPLTRPRREKPRIVYAGGTQSWQNVDLMFEIVAKCHDRFDFTFYSDDHAAMQAAARRHGVEGEIELTSCTADRLGEVYGQADLGLVLRDDIAVNRVACPTKLSEYLATGVVPIVELVEIGDFARLGYRYLTVGQILAGDLPDTEDLDGYRRVNRGVFEAVAAKHQDGRRALQGMANPAPRIDMDRAKSLFLTPMERTMVFPTRGSELEYVRGGRRVVVPLDDLAGPRDEWVFELSGEGALESFGFAPMERPFVTTPIVAHVIDAGGTEHEVGVRGNHRYDSFGNWIFDRGRPFVTGVAAVADPARLRFRFEYVLYGPEAAMAKRSLRGRRLPGGADR